MNLSTLYRGAGVIAVASMFVGCSSMNHTEKDTTIGAGSGAIAGAVVGGPVGAVVGAGVGGVAGHEVGESHAAGRSAITGEAMPSANAPSAMTRSIQQALNDKGYAAGPADGTWGPATEAALRRFQQTQGLPVTGRPDVQTRVALGLG
jgi:phage tail tape-measure protein